MRRGLLFVVLTFLSLWFFSFQTLYSQEREVVSSDKTFDLPFALKGARNPEVLTDLDAAYCSSGASDDIFLDASQIPDGNTNIVWSVITNVGGIPLVHPGWIDPIGSSPENGIRFFPERVESEFQGTAIYIQYQFDGGSWGYDQTYIRKSPTSFTLSGGTDVCQGTSATLTLDGSESSFEYVLLVNGMDSPVLPVSGNGNPINFVVSDPGVYTVKARRSNEPSCPEVMDGAPEIVVNVLPEPLASSNSAVCQGSSIELYGDSDGAATYSWSGPAAFASTELSPVLADASSAMAGTYTLTVVDANNCQNTSSTNVVVHENPTISVSNTGPVCENQSVTISAKVTGGTGPFSYQWEKDGVSLPLMTTPNIVLGSAGLSDTGVYEVFVTDINTCSNVVSATSTLVVNENPVIDQVNNNGPLCAGENLLLSVTASAGTGPYIYAWTGPEGFVSSDQSPVISNAPATASGLYQVTVTDANGCGSASSSTTVTVNMLPVSTATNDGPSCQGNDIQLSGGPDGMATYAWGGPLGFSNADQNPLLAGVITDMAGDYSLTVTDANGCSSSSTTPVVVNELPNASLSGSGPVCAGSTVVLSTTVTGGSAPYDYVWQKDGSILAGITTSTLTINNASAADGGVYEVLVTDANNCGNAVSASTTVVVNPNPVINTINNNGPVCEGQSLDLSLNVSEGTLPYSFAWTGPDGFSSTDQNPVISTVGLAGAGNYTAVVTDDNGCSSLSGMTNVMVNELPAVTVSNTGPVCEGEAVTISASVSGGTTPYSFLWTKNGVELVGVNTANISLSSVSVSDAGSYEVTVTDDNACVSVSASTTLMVNENPVVVLNGDVDICEGDNALFTATASAGDGNYAYSWSFNGSTLIGETNASLMINNATLAQTGNYMVSVTDGNSCSGSSASATLTVNGNPVVSIAGAPVLETCLGSDLTLDASASGGNGSYNFIWQLPDGSNVSGEDLTLNSITAAQAGIYQVFVTDGVSCGNTTQVEVIVNSATASISVSSPSGGSGICAGEAVTFNGGGGQNYTFYVNGAAVVANTTGIYTTSGLSTGDQVFVQVVDDKGCVDNSEVITMTVYPNPIVTLMVTSPNGNTPCIGQTVELTATVGFTNYVFYVNGGESQNGTANIFTTDALNTGDQVTVLAQSNEGCTGTSAPQSITFNPLPVATLVSDQPGDMACPGEWVTFTAGGGNTFEFLVDGISQGAPSGNNSFSMNAPAAGTSNIIVFVTDGNGCSNTASLDLMVHEWPVVTIDPDQTVCRGSNVSINAIVTGGAVPYSYSWTQDGNPLMGVTTSGLSFTDIASAQAGLYQVTVTDNNACPGMSVSESVDIVVNDRPSVTLSSNSPVCENSQITLSAIAYGGGGPGSFVWSKNGVEIPGQTISEYIIPNASLSDADTYEVVATDAHGCSSLPASTAVVVNEQPAATLVADQLNIFQGSEVTFTAGGGSEYVFFWNGTEVQPLSSNNVYTNNLLANGDEVSVEVFNSEGCSQMASVTIGVFDDVAVPNVTLENGTYCKGEAGANLIVENPMAGVSYEIVFGDNSGAGYPVIESDGISPLRWDGVTDLQNPTIYKVAAYRTAMPDNKIYSAEYPVVENALPDVYTMSVNGAVVSDKLIVSGCTGGLSYDIGLSPSWGPATYQLLLNDSVVLEEITGGPVPFYFEDYNQVGTYTIRAVSAEGCTTMMTGSFTIEGDGSEVGFDLSMVPADGQFCEGSSGVEIMLDGSVSGAEYILFKDGLPLDTVTGTGNSLSFGFQNQAGSYHAQVLTSNGCVYSMNNTLELVSQPAPAPENLVADNGGHYCQGESGVRISLDNQVSGIHYELIESDSKIVVDALDGLSGEGVLYFKTAGGDDFFTNETTYQVRAIDVSSGCEAFSNEVAVVMDALPDVYAFSGDDSFCSDGGVAVLTLDGSQNDVDYALFLDGSATGLTQVGDGNGFNFSVSLSGTYTVQATNTITGCSVAFSDAISVTEKPSPRGDLNVTALISGDAATCSEQAIVSVESTENGVNYELFKELSDGSLLYTGNVIVGDGNTLQFPDAVVDKAATYGVMATLDGCPMRLDNTVNIDIAGVPQRFELVYPTKMCDGDVVYPGLSGSEVDVEYELYRQGDASTVIQTLSSTTGSPLTFDPVTVEDTYFVSGVSTLTGCSSSMIGQMVLIFNPLPKDDIQMTGSGFHCGDGAVLGLESSEAGIEYRLLWDDGSTDVQVDVVMANALGEAISFNPQLTNGLYTVMAENPASGCVSTMDNTVTVIQKAAPAKPVTLETDTVYYCSDATGYNLAITNAEEGVTYQVYDNTDNFVIGAMGTSAVTLEVANLLEGAYVVRASWGGDACVSENSDSVWVFQAPDPEVRTPFGVDETIFRSGSSVDYAFEAGTLQDGVTYWLINETGSVGPIEFIVGATPATVTITEPGSYRLEGFFAGYGCQPISMNGRLMVLDEPLVAVEDYLYLNDGENIDSLYLGVNDVFSFIDQDNVEFALLDNHGDEFSSFEMAEGLFTLSPEGLFVFERAPSYYGTLEVTYKVWNKDHKDIRVSSAKVIIYVGNKDITEDKSILVPNAFSPNDDGYNDLFEVSVGRSLTEESRLEVFNRWGTLVYRSKGKTYDNLWDGTSNVSSMISIGDKLPNGVYFYIFTIRANVDGEIVDRKFNGFIELRR